MRKIGFVLLLLVIFFNNLFAANVSKNIEVDFDLVLKTKQIVINVDFFDRYKSIFKEFMKCSLDSEFISIKKWHIEDEPELDYIADFNSQKKVFNRPFKIEVFFIFLTDNKELILSELKNLNLYFYSLVIGNDNQTRSLLAQYKFIDRNNKNLILPEHFLDTNISSTFNSNLTLMISDSKNLLDNQGKKEIKNRVKNISKNNKDLINYDKNLFWVLILLFLVAFIYILPTNKNLTLNFIIAVLLISFILPLITKYFLLNDFGFIKRLFS